MHCTSRLTACLSVLLLSSAAFSQTNITTYGTATAGTGGKEPMLWPTATPRLGEKRFGVTIENGKPGAPAVVYFSFGKANTVLNGLRILINFASVTPLPFVKLDTKGMASYSLPIPNLAEAKGLRAYAQAYVADGGGAKIGFAASKGLDMTMGRSGRLVGKSSYVDLASGKITALTATSFVGGNKPAFTMDRSHLMMVGRGNVATWDWTGTAPKSLGTFKAQKNPWTVTMHPNGKHAYVLNQGPSGSNPVIQVVWALPKLFGTAVKGADIPLGTSISGLDILFTEDGNTGIYGSLGIGGPPGLTKYDTKVGSTTYHKSQGTTSLSGFVWSFAVLKDNQRVAACHGNLGQNCVVNLVDIKTMKIIDTDPKTPGVQSLGGANRTATAVVAGPRGKYLYVGTNWVNGTTGPGEMRRFVIDPKDPSYRKMTIVKLGKARGQINALAISDAGDRLYASDTTTVYELDTTTLKTLRTFKLPTGWYLGLR